MDERDRTFNCEWIVELPWSGESMMVVDGGDLGVPLESWQKKNRDCFRESA